MIDGITIKYKIEDFEDWKRSVNLSFGTTVDIDTADIKTKKRYDETITTFRTKWQTFDLIVKEVYNKTTEGKDFYLTIKGSLHKNYYSGKNYLPFSWLQLQEQINLLCTTLSINPIFAQISSLEVGVNVSTPFEVTPFLRQNIISYKGSSFNRWQPDKKGQSIGIYCTLTQYVVKIYDKGLQNDLPNNLMRIEKRFLKMYELNKLDIKFLSDLKNISTVKNLLPQLLEMWENVLIYDIEDLQKTAK